MQERGDFRSKILESNLENILKKNLSIQNEKFPFCRVKMYLNVDLNVKKSCFIFLPNYSIIQILPQIFSEPRYKLSPSLSRMLKNQFVGLHEHFFKFFPLRISKNFGVSFSWQNPQPKSSSGFGSELKIHWGGRIGTRLL